MSNYLPEQTLRECVVKSKYLLTLGMELSRYDKVRARKCRVHFECENAYRFIGGVTRLNRELKKGKGDYFQVNRGFEFTGFIEDWLVNEVDEVLDYYEFTRQLLLQIEILESWLESNTGRDLDIVCDVIIKDLNRYNKIVALFTLPH